MTLYTLEDANRRKTWLLFTIFLLVIVGIGFLFSQIYGNPAVLYLAIIVSLLMNFFSYWYSDKIVLKMSGARPAERREYFDFYTVTENLAIAAGLPMPKIFVIDDPSLNAFATGRDKEHSAIAVTSGLLSTLNRTELEGVIAHELSHVGNGDILFSTVVVILVGSISILSDLFLRSFVFGGRRDDRGSSSGLFILVGILMAILAPIIAGLLRLAISRRREFLADSSGALLTRYPEGLARALEKIQEDGRPIVKANKATAHLFLASPFGQHRIGWVQRLFMTHPPIEERVSLLRKMHIEQG